MKRKLTKYFWIWLPFLLSILVWWVSILVYSNAYMRGYKRAFKEAIQVLQETNNELRIELKNNK